LNSTATTRFNRLCLSTLVAVYILVMVGGVVRSTGSGMGCPDWPTCFGRFIPPTSVSQLPEDYKEQYAAYRDKKNQKFARYLSMIGLDDTAQQILSDKSILIEADFNPSKTWVEYFNRLVGVIIGLMIIALFAASWKIRKEEPLLFRGSMACLILVIIQGWFGSIVVSTNLTTWTITIHMFLAILIVAILVWLEVRSGRPVGISQRGIKGWLIASMGVLLLQIFFGTQVREMIDVLALSFPRENWISNAGMDFFIHRSFSWVVFIVQLVLWLKLRKTTSKKSLSLVPFVLILASVLTGILMAYLAVPPFLQPLHLLLAIVTFGWLFQVYLYADATEKLANQV
jgi:cytochrome c oxidase assembly protein subunit 15